MAKVKVKQVAPIDGKIYVVTRSGLLLEKFATPEGEQTAPFLFIELPDEPESSKDRSLSSAKPNIRKRTKG